MSLLPRRLQGSSPTTHERSGLEKTGQSTPGVCWHRALQRGRWGGSLELLNAPLLLESPWLSEEGQGGSILGFITVPAKTPGRIGQCQVRHDPPEKCQ